MRIRALLATTVLLPLLLGACGSDAADTTVSATTAIDTVAETASAADTAATDTVAATEASAVPTTIAAAAGAADLSSEVILKQMLTGMNGGKEPSTQDMACMGKEFPKEQMSKFIEAASSGGDPGPDVLAPLMTAMFTCKPAGLTQSLADSLNDDGSLDGVSAPEMECLASGLLDLLAKEPALMQEFVTKGATSALSTDMKRSLTKKATPTVEKCVKDGAMRTKVLASMAK